ncbi:sensor domain-containing phosphodiesterase, partial [Shigella flexneri]|nr:sensor domain-containing phosphodiesterase [Shigella flexneri]EFY5984866.1 sensor domain-containing phosphodiesterase [Shigella flexneri]EFZ0488531.1 sensor domain-containing phosphodiesterase [Shigella flexneri]EFZ0490982.1 sensor domain-containing phosphodiesterase [Shigella flexneri]
MKLNATYIKIRDKWWGLPLFLPSLILPIFAHINTFAHISSGEVFLFYLPLALMISMMMFFSWAALPGITLGIFVRKYAELGFYETLSLTANFIIILCWGGYRVFTPRRNNVSHGDTRLISQRIFWQIVFPATLFLILFQFAAFVGLLASRENLVGVPLCYFIIRVVRNPFYLRSYYSQLKQQVDAKVTKKEFALWLLVLGALLLLLCMPLNEKSTIFSTNYTLSLLLPLMMWGAMRYGYKLISLLWAVVLMISIHSYQNYIPIYPGYTTQLTITSSSYLVFSFIVNYMAVLATRQRAVVRRIQRLAYVDPVVHLPNVRALNRALRDAPCSALCYLRIPGMEMLVKNYGIMLRIQ